MKVGAGYKIGRSRAAQPDAVCRDRAAGYADAEVAVIAVANGAPDAKNPLAAEKAAELSVESMLRFFKDKKTWKISEKQAFKEAALQALVSAYEEEAAKGEFTYDELSSTISAAAVKANGEFLALSVGSGTVAALDQEMNPTVLIPPHRMSGNRTSYANQIGTVRKVMKAWGGTLEQSKFIAFAAFTDGASFLARRSAEGTEMLRTAAACTLFGSGTAYLNEILGTLTAKHTMDDAAIAIVADESKKALAAGKAVLRDAKPLAAEPPKEAEEEKAPENPEAPAPAEAAPPEKAPEKPAEKSAVKSMFGNPGKKKPEKSAPAPKEPPAPVVKEEAPAPAKEAPAPVQEEAPAQKKNAVSAEALESVAPMYRALLLALLTGPRSAEELVKSGYIPEGRVLETLLPLIRSGRVIRQDGKFVAKK